MFKIGRFDQEGLEACCTRGYIGIIGYMMELYSDNGKEPGNYYLGFRLHEWLAFSLVRRPSHLHLTSDWPGGKE